MMLKIPKLHSNFPNDISISYQRVPVYYSLLHKVSFALKDSGTSEGLAYPRPINFYSNLTPLPCRRKFFGPFPSCSWCEIQISPFKVTPCVLVSNSFFFLDSVMNFRLNYSYDMY